MAGPIRIAILADARNAVRGLDDTKDAAQKLGGGFGKLARGGAVVAAGIAAVGKSVV